MLSLYSLFTYFCKKKYSRRLFEKNQWTRRASCATRFRKTAEATERQIYSRRAEALLERKRLKKTDREEREKKTEKERC